MKIRQIAEKTAKIIGCTAVLAFFSALSADKVAAEDIGAEVSVGYDTDYMFRGVNLGQDLLWSDVNVSTSLSDGLDLGVGAWYANVADDAGNDELDIYAGLSTSMGDMSVDLGATYYYYPDPTAGEGTLEFGIGLGTSAGPIDLSLGLYYDIDLEAAYYEVGAATSFDLTDTMAVDVGGAIGNADGDTLTALTFTIGVPITLSDSASLSPYVGVNIPLDDYEDAFGDDIYSGLSLTVGF
ncbi:MAG: TorF family putative porin [Verrucomicrobiales bacterium]|tara:strand:- start:101 stop:817 length:717 start_codon:yes stop_codon:yes gene_type:complete